ncbi:DUF262 domain-containing protein [Photobacterium leiognathi]|uniref:DUF262 domain-containing protein n=1 Tax=Photobacterium leiognathi TaxID=553611 RepID=UPI00298140E8|nr:DUF262 domain-containing protein [Photobacterium leiognathi]
MNENVIPKTLDLYPIDYPFETLLSRINADEPKTILNPDFQRKYKWDKDGWKRSSKFIESCLMRIPLPSCYFAENDSRKHLVIDGVQRLTTIAKFFNDEFALEGLTTFKELEGKKFSEIGEYQAELESTTIRCIVLRKENPKKLIREIFSRLNQGAVKLTDQEIRHAIYPGKLDELLIELSQHPIISNFGLTETSTRTKDGREDEEQILRFFAFSEDINLETYPDALGQFLDNYMEDKIDLEVKEILELKSQFDQAISNCEVVFGKEIFSDPTKERAKQGLVYYDLLMPTVGLLDPQVVANKKEKIKAAYLELFNEPSFGKTLSGGLQKKTSILRRRNLWAPLLENAISD